MDKNYVNIPDVVRYRTVRPVKIVLPAPVQPPTRPPQKGTVVPPKVPAAPVKKKHTGAILIASAVAFVLIFAAVYIFADRDKPDINKTTVSPLTSDVSETNAEKTTRSRQDIEDETVKGLILSGTVRDRAVEMVPGEVLRILVRMDEPDTYELKDDNLFIDDIEEITGYRVSFTPSADGQSYRAFENQEFYAFSRADSFGEVYCIIDLLKDIVYIYSESEENDKYFVLYELDYKALNDVFNDEITYDMRMYYIDGGSGETVCQMIRSDGYYFIYDDDGTLILSTDAKDVNYDRDFNAVNADEKRNIIDKMNEDISSKYGFTVDTIV